MYQLPTIKHNYTPGDAPCGPRMWTEPSSPYISHIYILVAFIAYTTSAITRQSIILARALHSVGGVRG